MAIFALNTIMDEKLFVFFGGGIKTEDARFNKFLIVYYRRIRNDR